MIDQVQQVFEHALELTAKHLEQIDKRSKTIDESTGKPHGISISEATVIQNYVKTWSSAMRTIADENPSDRLSDDQLIAEAAKIVKGEQDDSTSDED